MPARKLSITMPEDVYADLELRLSYGQEGEENVSGAISRDLERYYAALERARKSLREKLSTAEVSAVLDNLNGVWHAEPFSIGLIYANVADGLEDGLAEKWKIDGPALVAKLKALSFSESAALVDCAERWWNRVANQEKPGFDGAIA